jgi:hypothetical protein
MPHFFIVVIIITFCLFLSRKFYPGIVLSNPSQLQTYEPRDYPTTTISSSASVVGCKHTSHETFQFYPGMFYARMFYARIVIQDQFYSKAIVFKNSYPSFSFFPVIIVCITLEFKESCPRFSPSPVIVTSSRRE